MGNLKNFQAPEILLTVVSVGGLDNLSGNVGDEWKDIYPTEDP